MKFIFFYVLFFSAGVFFSQTTKLISGPMQGHTTATTANLWMLVDSAKQVSVTLIDTATKTILYTQSLKTDSLPAYQKQTPVIFYLTNLNPIRIYSVLINIDSIQQPDVFYLKTDSDSTIKDFSFLTGSSAMLLPQFFSSLPFKVGTDKIFKNMANVRADFMLWTGDYLYYYKKDFVSPHKMWQKQINTRKRKNLNYFLKQMPHYSIWDDHDYGAFNGDKNFNLKDTSLFLHKLFWTNPSYGLPETKGVFTYFKKYDADFILLDGRFYRTLPNDKNKTILGKEQLDWLFEKLKQSDATFKFIVNGSQFLNELNDTSATFNEMADEGFSLFPEERKLILDYITANNIKGVIFISGDRHFTELQKLKRENNYPLYDFTCSPMTSFLEKPSKAEKQSTLKVPTTYVHQRNYGKVSIVGKKGERNCIIEVYSDKSKLLWRYKISEEELR